MALALPGPPGGSSHVLQRETEVLSVAGLARPPSRPPLWDFLVRTVMLASAPRVALAPGWGPAPLLLSMCLGMRLPAALCEAPRGHLCPLRCPKVLCWGQILWLGELQLCGPL